MDCMGVGVVWECKSTKPQKLIYHGPEFKIIIITQ